MDTFFEQIVAIRKTGKNFAALIGIWFLVFLIILLSALTGVLFAFLPIALLAEFGLCYGAYKLSSRFSIEYAYIVTNGVMDVDKIIAKSSRKRMLSFELQTVSRIEKYNPSQLNNVNQKEVVFACNQDDPDAYLLVSEKEGKGSTYLVFAPDERIRGAIVKFVPKFISNSAFK